MAQIMLNMVTPQTLQMPNIRQTSSSVQQSLLQDGLRDQKAVVPPFHGQTPLQNVTQPGILAKLPHGRVSSLAQSLVISNPSALQDGTVQPQLQHLQLGQPQYAPQTMILGKPGIPTFSSVDPKSLSGLSVSPPTTLITSKGLLPQIQPPLQQTKPIRDTSVGLHAQVALPNTNIQQSTLALPLSSQPGSSIDPLLPVGPEAAPVESRANSVNYDSAWGSRVNVHPSSITGLVEQPHMSQDGMELTGHPSKRVKLDGVSIIPQMGSSNTSRAKSEPAQVFDTGLTSVSQVVGVDGMQQSEKQISQLSPEMQKVLLEQVKSLTPEQLSSLPPEQRQQVIDLQQRLRLLDGLDAAL